MMMADYDNALKYNGNFAEKRTLDDFTFMRVHQSLRNKIISF